MTLSQYLENLDIKEVIEDVKSQLEWDSVKDMDLNQRTDETIKFCNSLKESMSKHLDISVYDMTSKHQRLNYVHNGRAVNTIIWK